MTLLPERILVKIDPADRKALGKAGKTMDEHHAENSADAERTMHSQYLSFLRRRGFQDDQIITSPMNKRSHLPPGFPDFQVMHSNRFLYIEFKAGGNILSPMQEIAIANLIAHGCTVLVAHSFSEAFNKTLKYFNLSTTAS